MMISFFQNIMFLATYVRMYIHRKGIREFPPPSQFGVRTRTVRQIFHVDEVTTSSSKNASVFFSFEFSTNYGNVTCSGTVPQQSGTIVTYQYLKTSSSKCSIIICRQLLVFFVRFGTSTGTGTTYKYFYYSSNKYDLNTAKFNYVPKFISVFSIVMVSPPLVTS